MKGIKTGGRIAGTPNKADLRQQLLQVFETTLQDLPAILAAMPPTERAQFMATLLPHLLPKVVRVEVTGVGDEVVKIAMNKYRESGY